MNSFVVSTMIAIALHKHTHTHTRTNQPESSFWIERTQIIYVEKNHRNCKHHQKQTLKLNHSNRRLIFYSRILYNVLFILNWDRPLKRTIRPRKIRTTDGISIERLLVCRFIYWISWNSFLLPRHRGKICHMNNHSLYPLANEKKNRKN